MGNLFRAENAEADVEQSVGFLKRMCARHSSESSCVAKGCAWDNDNQRCNRRMAEYDCKEGTIASGYGFVVHRLNFADCQKKFESGGMSFVYYGPSRHCQASHGDGVAGNHPGWTFCRALPAAEETADLAMKTGSDVVDHPSLIVYGFALLGFSAMMYGAGRHFFSKRSGEHT